MTCGPSEARSICAPVLYPTAVSVRRVFVASAFCLLVLKLMKSSFAVVEVQFCGCGSPAVQSLKVAACLTALACVFVFCVLVALRQLWRGRVQDVAAICHCATMRPRAALYERTRESPSVGVPYDGGAGKRVQIICPLPILFWLKTQVLQLEDPVVVWRETMSA